MSKGPIIIGGLLAAAAIAGGIYWFNFRTATVDENAVYVQSVSELTGLTAGVTNRFAGVVEAQKTVDVSLESGRNVSEVKVKVGDNVKAGDVLFEYDLSTIETDLRTAELELAKLKNEAQSYDTQINSLQTQWSKAENDDDRLTVEIEIEQTKLSKTQNEYNQVGQEAKIEKLKAQSVNNQVLSEIDGIIQKIDTSKMTTEDATDTLETGVSSMSASSDSSNAFITILSTGNYRVKGTINEQNINQLTAGDPLIIRSRMDESLTWRGVMGTVDMKNSSTGSSDMYSYSSDDSNTSSSSYPFYVELESSEGLMLGQHVYIERDEGQEDGLSGLWIDEDFIVDADTSSPYVWARDKDDKLEKRTLTLGEYNSDLGKYKILDGLDYDDMIAYPDENCIAGAATTEQVTEIKEIPSGNEDDEILEEDAYDPNSDTVDFVYDEITDEEFMTDDFMTEDMSGSADLGGFTDEDFADFNIDAESSDMGMDMGDMSMDMDPDAGMDMGDMSMDMASDMGDPGSDMTGTTSGDSGFTETTDSSSFTVNN